MKKRALIPLLILVMIVGSAQLVAAHTPTTPTKIDSAQTGFQNPPTIISFTADIESVSLEDAEEGTVTATLTWQTVGMTDDYDLVLHEYGLGSWIFLLDEEEKLPANGSREVTVHHPLHFRAPTFRLGVTDAERVSLLLEHTVSIPYEVEEDAAKPQIESFTTTVDSVTADDLAYARREVPVTWEVSGRTPTSNLVFEQVLADGTTESVELPRVNLWISSSGEGAVAPDYPGNNARSVEVRLRLVDLVDDTTLDEETITIGVTGTLSTPTPVPTNAPVVNNNTGNTGNTSGGNSGGTSGGNTSPPVVGAGTGGGFELGGHVHGFGRVNEMRSAGMSWAKVQVRYNLGDGTGAAAGVINQARANGLKILLGVVGNPSQMGDFNAYSDAFAAYLGQVAALAPDAIEVWNEPNLAREWPNGTISGANYTTLLSKSFNAIKSANPNVMVVSAALAPTGFFGGCQAGGCDDNVFLQQMRNAGATNYMDCIGAHYNEGIISPDQRSGDPRGGHYSRYFWGTLDLYYNAFGGARKVCITELGYLTGEGFPPLPANFAWAQGTTLAQHAEWLGRATALARGSGRVRLMIIWNVDITTYNDDPQAGYAIVRPDGSCPACGTLAAAMQ